MEFKQGEKDCEAGFEQAFSDLYFVSKDVYELPFDNLLVELEKKKNDEIQEDLNVLGVQLPSFMFYGSGTILVIIFQLYFFLHLRILTSVINKLDEIPSWIGLFPDTFSRIITMLSVNIIPSLLVIGLNLQAIIQMPKSWDSLPRVLLIFLPVSVEAMLLSYMYFEFINIWKSIDEKGLHNFQSSHKNRSIRKKNRN
jgi:hypothetical protein